MVTDQESQYAALLSALVVDDWSQAVTAIESATRYLQQVTTGDTTADTLVRTLVDLSDHEKWEIRRAVAQLAARVLNPEFEPVLVRLVADDNARVRQAAQQAVLRRRDWRNASALGRQHEDRINATLDDIEIRFGSRGREAVKRASEEIANTFARELYHEVIKLITPLVAAVNRLQNEMTRGETTTTVLGEQAQRIARQVKHLQNVLDAMRMYAAVPRLEFASESLREIVEEAAHVARAWKPDIIQPMIEIDVPSSYLVDVARPRLVQALTNVLVNAIESYDGFTLVRAPIVIKAQQRDGVTTVSIQDAGCGMSPEVLQDAPTLFASSKPGGTGVGLPLVMKIVESEHGGRLTLQSEKTVGTIVTVRIPSIGRQPRDEPAPGLGG